MCIRDRSCALGAEARRTISAGFSWESVCRSLDKLYTEVLGED
jgi:glycosyltransferase involved in cell wall biosynthesis